MASAGAGGNTLCVQRAERTHQVLCSELSRKVRGNLLGVLKIGFYGGIGMVSALFVVNCGCCHYKSNTCLL